LQLEAIEGYDQNSLEATITKLADVNVITDDFDYTLFIVRWWLHEKMLEVVVKVLVAGSGDVVLGTIFVTIWILKILRLCHDLRGECYLCEELDDKGYHGLLIDGKEDLTCVETLYRWVVGFDEVLVAESNMTKISKLKRWFSLQNNFAISELGGASTCLLKN
nr:hypothetical protein [Tanacetum cinerariifolium]